MAGYPLLAFSCVKDQEGLPAYWGIETVLRNHIRKDCLLGYETYRRPGSWFPKIIRKDYPLTGVLKLDDLFILASYDQEDYPTLKLINAPGDRWGVHQEGLPAYWGIETKHTASVEIIGLPAYWGIETIMPDTYCNK